MPDGGLEFLGRSDGQLKIRGFGVEPGESAAALSSHDGVHGAYVTARSHADGRRLTAHVQAGRSRQRRPTCVRWWSTGRLAIWSPHHIVILEEWPLTPNGKIDENTLAATDVAEGPATPPERPTEVALAQAFIDVA